MVGQDTRGLTKTREVFQLKASSGIFQSVQIQPCEWSQKPIENSKRESVNAEFSDVGRSVRLSKVETVRYIGYSVV